MGIIHLEQAKALREQGKRLGRAGMSRRALQALSECDGSYKGVMVLTGRMKAIAHMAACDSYWDEQVVKGYQHEVNNIASFENEESHGDSDQR